MFLNIFNRDECLALKYLLFEYVGFKLCNNFIQSFNLIIKQSVHPLKNGTSCEVVLFLKFKAYEGIFHRTCKLNYTQSKFIKSRRILTYLSGAPEVRASLNL